MAMLTGHESEDRFFGDLSQDPFKWGCTACSRWDDEQQIDRVLTSRAGEILRRQIEVQFTLCFDHPEKLDRFLKKQRPGGRHVAEIYTEVEGRISSADAAKAFDAAVCARFEIPRVEAGIYMLRIKTDGTTEWFDPMDRVAFLWQEADRMWHSASRRYGRIVTINGYSMVVECVIHGRKIEYYVPFTRIVDSRLKRMATEKKLSKGMAVSLYPSGYMAEHHELALSVRPL